MSELDPSFDWNLLLIATSPDGPERVSRMLAGAVGVCGGWILSRRDSGEECAEIDFEFPRANCVEIYSVLVALGLILSREAHLQLAELCQCTNYLIETKAFDIVRLNLTVYCHTAEAREFQEETEESKQEAA